jgi:hypothetical protein
MGLENTGDLCFFSVAIFSPIRTVGLSSATASRKRQCEARGQKVPGSLFPVDSQIAWDLVKILQLLMNRVAHPVKVTLKVLDSKKS